MSYFLSTLTLDYDAFTVFITVSLENGDCNLDKDLLRYIRMFHQLDVFPRNK